MDVYKEEELEWPPHHLRVPKGVKHTVYDVQEDTLLYDVFSPATL